MGVRCPDLHADPSSSPPAFCRAFWAWVLLHQPGQEKAWEGVREGVPADGREATTWHPVHDGECAPHAARA